MGRRKLNDEAKKVFVSVALESTIYDALEDLQMKSKSQLINWLLKEHFNLVNKKCDFLVDGIHKLVDNVQDLNECDLNEGINNNQTL